MTVARILLIGRSQVKGVSFSDALNKRYELVIVSNGKHAQSIMAELRPHAIVLDAVSMRTPGERICRTLQASCPEIPIIHLHPGPKSEANSPADVIIFPPFSSPRKLINAIERLITMSDDEIITCGPFSLNIERRTLTTPRQETQLTPKVALLAALFLSRPGETLDRKTIMEEVWETDYLGDTRTLDVHIRWIREAIEENPGKPHYLKTVRGIGYCLEVSVNGR